MITKIVSRSLIAAALFSSASINAQSYFMNDGQHIRESRMQVGLVVPIGPATTKSNQTPRLSFSLARHRYSWTETNFRPLQRQIQHNRFSLTLENDPVMMLNGKRLQDENGKLNLTTGAGIAIGAGVLAGVLLFATLETADEINDLVDPD